MLLWNMILALTWSALNGQFSLGNLLAGFVIGYLLLWTIQPVVGRSRYFLKVRQVAELVLFYTWELISASFRVAYDVITPAHHMHPGVIAVPLDVETDAEITLFANLLTLTPGTCSLDVSTDRKTLYIHVMYLDPDGIDATRRQIKEGFERRVLELMR